MKPAIKATTSERRCLRHRPATSQPEGAPSSLRGGRRAAAADSPRDPRIAPSTHRKLDDILAPAETVAQRRIETKKEAETAQPVKKIAESIRAKMENTITPPGFTEVRRGILKRTPPKAPAVPGITDTKPRTLDKQTARVSDRVPLNQSGWNIGVAAKARAIEELARYDAVAGDQPGSDLRATEQTPGDERGNFPPAGSDSPTGASNEKDRKDGIDDDKTSS
jgi:hypothetical protein